MTPEELQHNLACYTERMKALEKGRNTSGATPQAIEYLQLQIWRDNALMLLENAELRTENSDLLQRIETLEQIVLTHFALTRKPLHLEKQ